MNRFMRSILLIAGLLLSAMGILRADNRDVDIDAEIFWIDRGMQKDIMLSRLESDAWSKPEPVYSTENPITSLAVATDLDGATVLIWTERLKIKTVLMHSQRFSQQQGWSKAELFSDFGKENFAASMVVDRANRIWLFWAANHGDLDDIYMVRRNLNGWSEPLRIHPANAVPDIRPQAQLNQHGNIYVEWQSYSFDESDYLSVNREFKVDKSLESLYKAKPKENAEMALTDLSLPAFIPIKSAATVHFPNNRLLQTETLKFD